MTDRMRRILFPVVMAVRLMRKLHNRPGALSGRLFAYDRKRFVRNAGCFHSESRSAGLARIIMAYHVLEKGLTMPRRRLNFGHSAVLDLVRLVDDFERSFGCDEPQVRHAVGCVKEYFELHCASQFDMSGEPKFWVRVKAFCESHPDIPPTKQVEMTREAFFADNEAPFPVFAAARHTSRHYEGIVKVERIKNAVELAMTAPSACNRQFVKVYCVSDHAKRDALFSLQNGNRGFGKDADKLLVVTADLSGNRWAEERNDLYTNAGIFIMNLCYALHYNRIAHCILNWSVSPRNDRSGHRILGLPDNEAIVVLISCGNAPDRFHVASSPRKSIQDVFAEIK